MLLIAVVTPLTITPCTQANDSPLAVERDRSRPLVLVAPSAADPAAIALSQSLARPETKAAFADRQIVVFRVLAGRGEREGRALTPAATVALLKAIGLHTNGAAEFVLIGKDGGVKMRLGQLSVPDILATIDRMPMRRQETNRP